MVGFFGDDSFRGNRIDLPRSERNTRNETKAALRKLRFVHVRTVIDDR